MSDLLKEALMNGDKDATNEAIRAVVRDAIATKANEVVNEALDTKNILSYAAKFGSNLGIAGAAVAFVASMATMGGFPVGIAAGAGVASAVSGFFWGRNRAMSNPQVIKKLMNTQVGNKFDELTRVVEQRDQILGEFARYTSVKERNAFNKRVGGKVEMLTKRMKQLSKELRADLLELGDDLEINEYDRENLMAFLEKGEQGAVSDVLSDRQKVEKMEQSLKDEAA